MTTAQDDLASLPQFDRWELLRLWRASGFLHSSTLGLAHGVSDCAAGFLIGRPTLGESPEMVAWLALAYNILAFGLQPLAGWLAWRAIPA